MSVFTRKGANLSERRDAERNFMSKSKTSGEGFTARKIVLTAVFAAASLVMFMVENLFPPLFVPGAKAGLSNIPTLFLLYTLGFPYAFSALVTRIVLGNLLTGSLSSLIYSLPSGIIAMIVAFILKKTLKCSVVAVSAACAVVHNLVQNTVFIFVSETPGMAAYYPYLALVGILAGLVVGAGVTLLLRSETIEKAFKHKESEENSL